MQCDHRTEEGLVPISHAQSMLLGWGFALNEKSVGANSHSFPASSVFPILPSLMISLSMLHPLLSFTPLQYFI